MDVILHIGAHRCATTTFQTYLRLNTARLEAAGVGFWGPRRTRAGLFRGLLPGPGPATGRDLRRRALGRVRMQLARSAGRGLKTLLVSDENMMGAVRENLRIGELYSGVGERMARFAEAFEGRLSAVVLNVRAPENYWASALGYGLARGHGMPGPAALERLSGTARGWREVITDLACAVPGARLGVLPFETFAGRPEAALTAMTGQAAPKTHARAWLNATPRLPELRALAGPVAAAALPAKGEGRWQPFAPAQIAALSERYADDLMWLAAGADGLARLIGDPDKDPAGMQPAGPPATRGRCDDDEDRRMARAR